MLQALVRHLEHLSRHGPVLMVFEDAHWIDPTSLELLQLIVDRVQRLPVLLLATFRPEFNPPWIGQPHVTLLALGRLNRRESALLIAEVAGSKELSADIVDEIVERTDGVPLFIEELTKAVLETGAEEGDRKAALSRTPSATLAVPAMLHGLLMARLDRLGTAAKAIAQIGAVIGREFSYELLSAVAQQSDIEVQHALDQLVSSGLIFQSYSRPRLPIVGAGRTTTLPAQGRNATRARASCDRVSLGTTPATLPVGGLRSERHLPPATGLNA